VFVSLFGPEAQRKATWRGLEQARAFIRSELAQRIRLRKTPEIVFRLDDTIEKGARIEQQLRTLNVDGASDATAEEPPGGEGGDGDR
jgi:ribosome-binding factor A